MLSPSSYLGRRFKDGKLVLFMNPHPIQRSSMAQCDRVTRHSGLGLHPPATWPTGPCPVQPSKCIIIMLL
jgi:hypothetical protein